MVQTYKVFGMEVGSHVLAMVTLGTVFGITALSMRGGGDKAKQANMPPIKAESKDEESFIREFLAKAEEEGKKVPRH